MCSLDCEVKWGEGLCGLKLSETSTFIEIFFSVVGGGDAIATLPIALDARE